MDNATAFRSGVIERLCKKWGVRCTFRCAYKPSGNGIVERNHRTIKRMASRTGSGPLDMVYWYNVAARDPATGGVSPSDLTHTYTWRYPDEAEELLNDTEGRFAVGETVFVKPPDARCTSRWNEGIVTKVNSSTNFEINGMPRHISDIRKRDTTIENEMQTEVMSNDVEVEETEESTRRSTRMRNPPRYFDDYEMSFSDDDITGRCS